MSADVKPSESEIAAAIREMLDGFREAGLLPNVDDENAIENVSAQRHPERDKTVPRLSRPQG